MKPPRFEYHRPSSRSEVVEMLAGLGEDAKILAGGQSLVPMLNFRLARPAHLIDINHLRDEPTEPVASDGWMTFGPIVRQATAAASEIVARDVPLLTAALKHVAHPAIRTRGTIVGSIAHADPAAELPAVLLALGGEAVVRSSRGERTISAPDCFAGPLVNSLEPDEWIEQVRLPFAKEGESSAFEEFSRRSGDYALCGVAAVSQRTGDRASMTLAYLGVGVMPHKLQFSERSVSEFAHPSFRAELTETVSEQLRPYDDIHATAAYKRHLAVRLGEKAARRALGVAA